MGAGITQVPAIEVARNRGHLVVIIENDVTAAGTLLADQICSDYPFHEVGKIIQWVDDKGLRPAAVISFCSDAGMALSAELSNHFGLVGDSLHLTTTLTNKWEQRRALENSGLNPGWRALRSETEAKNYLGSAPPKFILKPADSAGSRGVSVLSPNDPEALSKIHGAFKYSKTGTILAEEFIEGTEFTVDGFVIKGSFFPLLVTEKRRSAANPTVADQLVSVSVESPEYEIAVQACRRALVTIGRSNGPFHIEVIVNGSEVKLVEIAGRGGGFLLASRMIAETTGVDYTSLTLDFYLGLDIESELRPTKNLVSILEFVLHSTGFLKKLELPDFCSPFGTVIAGPLKKVGDEIPEIGSDGDRVAWLLASSKTRNTSERLLEEVRQQIAIDVAR